MTNTSRLNLSAGLASVATAIALVALKLWALGQTGSLSIAASLADSALDLMVSLGALAAIFYAARPPDDDHAFGHSAAEDLAALGQAVFILASASIIAFAAMTRLLAADPEPLSQEGPGMVAMAVSIVLTASLVLYQRRVARKTGNRVVEADSLHYLGDLLPNIGAIFALWASANLGLARIDAVIALAAAGMLAVGALGIGKGAWDALMDRAAPPETIARIEALAGDCAGVRGFHDLKTRRSGPRLFVNLHIELDGAQSLNDAHAIGARLKHAILEEFPGADVIIHFDPAT
ncbi:cation diffusion facilitator family transporter [Rhodovulum sp. MB263]|uniref:cation diffusion facilitator family transporter n=1 Tax=Rhodovulum sp. (strain MB263) TaxID=308754 RepID=UPI0009B7440C|nr:cation diffusion facilitator family transporter [Rhodovulum sp. MB263]ARC87965.1 cation-efflux pump [Rhodovulum sp. MB263]